MSFGVNKAIVVGYLGQDPDVRYMPSGKQVTSIRVATSESWKKDGEKQERTEWHSIVAFDKLAEIMGQYLKKGAAVYVEGKIQTRKWQDKEGKDRYSTEIVASQMQMIGKANSSASQKEQQEPAPFDDEIPF